MSANTWKVLGIAPSPNVILVVLVSNKGDSYVVSMKDAWNLDNYPDRGEAYKNIRTRFCDMISTHQPDRICVKSLERSAIRNAGVSWFSTAEIRGVLQEAAASCGVTYESRGRAEVGKIFGGKKVTTCLTDDTFWNDLHVDVPKKFREPCLLAIASLRELEK